MEMPVDYTEVEPIGANRLHPFLQHYVITTVDFMNRFSCICEEKLRRVSRNLERLEIVVTNLESKLSSIPGLDGAEGAAAPAAPSTPALPSAGPAASSSAPPPPPPPPSGSGDSAAPPPPPPPPGSFGGQDEVDAFDEPPRASGGIPADKDPRFTQFFKLLKIGVHPQQIKNKMMAAGVDPDILDNPSEPVAGDGSSSVTGGGGGGEEESREDDDGFSSAASDSDDGFN